tara:strand:- start:977 stop:1117 length:141 start_codon:yes stop_codon:yes gene_type:complete
MTTASVGGRHDAATFAGGTSFTGGLFPNDTVISVDELDSDGDGDEV